MLRIERVTAILARHLGKHVAQLLLPDAAALWALQGKRRGRPVLPLCGLCDACIDAGVATDDSLLPRHDIAPSFVSCDGSRGGSGCSCAARRIGAAAPHRPIGDDHLHVQVSSLRERGLRKSDAWWQRLAFEVEADALVGVELRGETSR